MADFGASYAEMESVSKKLAQGKEDIEGTLDDLRQQVDTLLGEDFITQQASGKVGEGYTELNNGLKEAIGGIDGMSEALLGMMRKIQELDSQMAGG